MFLQKIFGSKNIVKLLFIGLFFVISQCECMIAIPNTRDFAGNSVESLFSRINFPIKIARDCSLRPFVESDAKALAGVIDRNRDFLEKTMDWPDHYRSEADSLSFINQALTHYLISEGWNSPPLAAYK